MRYPTWLKRYEHSSKHWPKYINFVGVLWKDAAHSEESANAGTIQSLIGGTVVEATKDHLKIAMEVFEDESDRDVTTVPASLILKVIPCFVTPLFKP